MIKLTYVFDRKKKCKDNNTKGVIELRAYEYNQAPLIVSTKQTIKPNEWDEQTQRVNRKNLDYEDINFHLDKYLQDLKDIRMQRKFRNINFTLDDVKSYFKKSNNKTSSYIEFVKQELKLDMKLSKKTKAQHNNTLNKLLEYKKGDVLFTDLTVEFLDNFLNDLRSKNYQPNYIHNFHKNIKTYFKKAIDKEYTDLKNPCEVIKSATEQTKFDALTMQQLKQIRNLKLNDHDIRLTHVRDMFLFASYTGLRISDITVLKTNSIESIKEGLKLRLKTKKTGSQAFLPLYKLFKDGKKASHPEQIVNTYLSQDQEYLFPRIPEQKINEHLKIIGNKIKLDFNLTFHVARHTFGTIMSSKVSPFELMELLQHASVKTTMIYVNLNEKNISNSLEGINWKK